MTSPLRREEKAPGFLFWGVIFSPLLSLLWKGPSRVAWKQSAFERVRQPCSLFLKSPYRRARERSTFSFDVPSSSRPHFLLPPQVGISRFTLYSFVYGRSGLLTPCLLCPPQRRSHRRTKASFELSFCRTQVPVFLFNHVNLDEDVRSISPPGYPFSPSTLGHPVRLSLGQRSFPPH